MQAYLFLWNPSVDPDSFIDYEVLTQEINTISPYETNWICPSTRPRPGDRVYMKRTGVKNNGLFARGWVVSMPFESDGIRSVQLRIESILPLGNEINKSVLDEPVLNATHWTPQASGTTIKPESAELLERIWPSQESNELKNGMSSENIINEVGAGFGNTETNQIVEKTAIVFVTNYYKNKKYDVKSVESEKIGYDLLCKSEYDELHLEVKGVSGTKEEFIITANEINSSINDTRFLLVLVTNVLNQPQIHLYDRIQFESEFDIVALSYRAKKNHV